MSDLQQMYKEGEAAGGRLVIDAHVHLQRFTPGFSKQGERFTYDELENAIMSELPFDTSRALLADMDRFDIDKDCVLNTFAMRNEMIHEPLQRYPDRFIGFRGFVDMAEFDPEKATGDETRPALAGGRSEGGPDNG